MQPQFNIDSILIFLGKFSNNSNFSYFSSNNNSRSKSIARGKKSTIATKHVSYLDLGCIIVTKTSNSIRENKKIKKMKSSNNSILFLFLFLF